MSVLTKNLFTSESVSEGHPDKICDAVSDAILDECLRQDKNSRTAVECLVTRNKLVISGEITTKADVDYDLIARRVIKDIGYDDEKKGLDYKTVIIDKYITAQSPDIALGVDEKEDKELGAGDQGIMFGYATDETSNYMPLAISIAHKLVRYATNLRKSGEISFARPDMKSQVTIDYTSDKPTINAVVFSMQHDESVSIEELRQVVKDKVIIPVLESFDMPVSGKEEFYINPTGRFIIGGPSGDTGLTGRKLIVDTYGGYAPHGGGSFSGKDATKVDRSAAYMARYAAKNIVASKLAKKCLIQVSYAIGVSQPVSITVDTFNTETVSKEKILQLLLNEDIFDFTPAGIINNFRLKTPSFRYQDLSSYGHFGRPDLDLPFEKLDKVDQIKSLL